MKTFNEAQLSALKLAEITVEYNKLAEVSGDKQVKKFRDKPTAIARTLQLQALVAPYMEAKEVEEKPVVTLTEKEHVALMAIAQNGMDQMGGEEPADLHGDNCSWFDNGDLIQITGMSKHQCSGLMAALEEKGLIVNSEEGVNGEGPDQWYMSDEGIDLAQSLKDEPLPEIKKEAKKASKGNSKTDMNAKIVIAKQRNNQEGSIGEMIFNHIAENADLTVQELVDFMVANYTKPRSNVPVTAAFVINSIRYFVREGSLKFQ